MKKTKSPARRAFDWVAVVGDNALSLARFDLASGLLFVALLLVSLLPSTVALAADEIDADAITKAVQKYYQTQERRLTEVRDRVAANKITDTDQRFLGNDLKDLPPLNDRKKRLALQKELVAKLDGQIASVKRGEWAGRMFLIGPDDRLDVGTVGIGLNVAALSLSETDVVCRRPGRSNDGAEYVLRGFDSSKWVHGKSYFVEGFVVVSGIEIGADGRRRLIVEPAARYWPPKTEEKAKPTADSPSKPTKAGS